MGERFGLNLRDYPKSIELLDLEPNTPIRTPDNYHDNAQIIQLHLNKPQKIKLAFAIPKLEHRKDSALVSNPIRATKEWLWKKFDLYYELDVAMLEALLNANKDE